MKESMLAYYAAPGPMTDLGQYADLFITLPEDIQALAETIRGFVVHIFWAERMGLQLDETRQAEVSLRPVREKLHRLIELHDAPLDQPRPLEQRLVCNCRDFSVLFTAILRARGLPARARCGFATYFTPGKFEDHWVVEYWKAAENRWVQIDTQLDTLQRQVLKIDFDPVDMPQNKFILAGDAWQMARSGQADPDKFGIFEWHGLDFIRGNLLRDLLSLNKVEVLPWDFWGLLQEKSVSESSATELAYLDHLASLTLKMDASFPDVRTVYDQNPSLQVPPEWIA
ncbi:MAG TPA: transglutaminase-like domain-containing protein [Anaerolineaceae bacterium]